MPAPYDVGDAITCLRFGQMLPAVVKSVAPDGDRTKLLIRWDEGGGLEIVERAKCERRQVTRRCSRQQLLARGDPQRAPKAVHGAQAHGAAAADTPASGPQPRPPRRLCEHVKQRSTDLDELLGPGSPLSPSDEVSLEGTQRQWQLSLRDGGAAGGGTPDDASPPPPRWDTLRTSPLELFDPPPPRRRPHAPSAGAASSNISDILTERGATAHAAHVTRQQRSPRSNVSRGPVAGEGGIGGFALHAFQPLSPHRHHHHHPRHASASAGGASGALEGWTAGSRSRSRSPLRMPVHDTGVDEGAPGRGRKGTAAWSAAPVPQPRCLSPRAVAALIRSESTRPFLF